MKRVLVAGMGSEHRGDDAAGLLAVRALRKLQLSGVDVEEFCDGAVSLAESMSKYSEVIVVDAVASDVPVGTVLSLSIDDARCGTATSSHGLGLGEAIALAGALGAQPAVRIFGIAGRTFDPGAAPNDAVVRGATEVAAAIAEQLRCA